MTEQASGKPIFDVTVGQGKFRFVQDAKYKCHVWRNGHRWEAYDANSPDNLHIALATDLHDLREEVAANKATEDRAAALLHELRLVIDALPNPSNPAHLDEGQLLVDSSALSKLHALVEPLKDIVHEDRAGQYGHIYHQGIDKDGKEIQRGSRTSLNPRRDLHLMDSFLLFNEAYELRDVQIPEQRLGSMLIRPAPEKDPERLKE